MISNLKILKFQKEVHVALKCVYYEIILWKKSSKHHCCSNVWNSEDPNAISIILLVIYI
jgi:hypothetical protein